MSYKWTEYTVEQLVQLGMLDPPMDGNHGAIHPKTSDYVDDGVPFVMANDLSNGTVNFDSCARITEAQAKTLRKGFSRPGDVLLTHKATIGRTAIVPEVFPTIILTPQVTYYRVRRGISNRFLKYYFDSPTFQKVFNNWAGSGSTRAYLGITAQRKLPIVLPPLSVQEKIAQILGSLDDKIKLNNRINENLLQQAMAQFVQTFIENPPCGERRTLYDFAEYINGAAFKQDDYSAFGLPIIRIAELKNGITDSTQFFAGDKGDKYLVHDKDILFSWSGNPNTSIDIYIWASGDAVLNQHTFNVKSKEGFRWFMYLMLKSFKPQFAQIASNKQTTGLGHVTVADLKRLSFIYNRDEIASFEEMIGPTMELVFNNMLENHSLFSLRDAVLPKLMSGELDVSDIDL